VTSLLSRLCLKKGPLFILKLSVWFSSLITQLAFYNVSKGGDFYRVKKHIKEVLILPELLSDNLSNVPEDILQQK
jgi:hypothetical protein